MWWYILRDTDSYNDDITTTPDNDKDLRVWCKYICDTMI